MYYWARNGNGLNCEGLSGQASLEACTAYIFAPLVGGLLAGLFEELHN